MGEPAKPGGPKPDKSEKDSDVSPVELSPSLLRSPSSDLSTMEGKAGKGEKGEKGEEEKEKMKDKLEDIMSSDDGQDPPKVDADCDQRYAQPNVPCKPGKATPKNEWTPKNEILSEGESRPDGNGR